MKMVHSRSIGIGRTGPFQDPDNQRFNPLYYLSYLYLRERERERESVQGTGTTAHFLMDHVDQ